MKALMTAALALGLSHTAFGKTIATYQFERPSNIMGANSGADTVDVALTSDGDLKVVEKVYANFQIGQKPIQTIETSISLVQSVNDLLSQDVQSLSTAEIQTTHSVIVCMMMPPPGLANNSLSILTNYDYQKNQYTGPMTVVLGPSGCYLSTHIAPKDSYYAELAHRIEDSIRILALQALGDK